MQYQTWWVIEILKKKIKKKKPKPSNPEDANAHILVPTGQLAPTNDVYIYMQMYKKES